ncbi:hypothetical protein ATY30_00750 [Sinorhizobium americanum]|nr:hypothetical protein CO664_25565 [Sinorhizobium sp. NG07B]POH33885.1 hypothetical protein ATY30_00750 [Sinorhizobium americanum]
MIKPMLHSSRFIGVGFGASRQPDGFYPLRVPTLQGAVIDLLKGERKHVLPLARFVDRRS